MAFSPSFTASSVSGAPSQIIFTDTSTGTDGAITSRQIYIATDSGTFLVPTGTTTDYIVWVIANATKNVDVLDKDYALILTVNWLNVSGTVLYSATGLVGFTSYNEEFDYQLTQLLSGNPLLINDNNFYTNKSDLRTDIDSGNQAIVLAADIFGAQQSYDRATNSRLNSQYLYNANS